MLFFLQYSQLGNISVGPISYAEDEDGHLLPLVVCKRYYKRGTVEPSDDAYDIDAQLEQGVCVCAHTVCVFVVHCFIIFFPQSQHISVFTDCFPYHLKTQSQWKTENASFFSLEFYR